MQTKKSSIDPSIYIINRTAIDLSGRVGSLYDAYQDRLIGQLNIIEENKLYEKEKLLRCGIVHGNNDRHQNFLRLLNIDEQLRLSILLKLVPNKGIASIINYPYILNKHTRLLYYSYIECIQRLPDRIEDAQKFLKSSIPKIKATHIITNVEFGINLAIILQLPSNNDIRKNIDNILKRIYTCLYCNYNTSWLICEEEKILEKILQIKIYSNIPDLCNMTTLHDVCQYIEQNKTKNSNYPILYQLRPIQWFYPQYNHINGLFNPISLEFNDNIEQYIFQLTSDIKILETFLNDNLPKLINQYNQDEYSYIQKQWLDLQNKYTIEIDRISKLIIDIRSGKIQKLTINQAFQNREEIILKNSVRGLTDTLKSIEDKAYLNKNLIQYHHLSHTKTEHIQSIEHTSNKLHENFDEQDNNQISTNTHTSNTSLLPIDDNINILLLGETGVGKSTFINSIVNYLTYKTLQQAQIEKPIALIPVSFLITVNDNLDKRTIVYNNINNSNNEDFNHPGQTITQHCKSYVFHIGNNNKKKLRIIDTPGFGDVRGIDQDNQYMKHILEFIQNLTHLNAICFLVKSNALHLHQFFRSCLTQLFSLLYPDARNNIIFCFTNSRSNFYTSGNTNTLIKTMLDSISIGDIPFDEENIFCFDNESFRYLIALEKRIPFSDHEKQEYEMSWSASTNELNRFIDYITKNLIPHRIRDDFQSIKHVQYKIIHIIRPILETIRNILRNIVLWNMDSPNRSIQLHPKVPNHQAIICLLCKPFPYQIGNIWIGNIQLHNIENECRTCQCSLDQHIDIDYILEYDYSSNSSKYDRNQMKYILENLCHTSVEFYHYLLHTVDSIKDDPFIIYFNKMISEEIYLSESQKPNYLNLQLVEDLKQYLNKYEQKKANIVHNKESHDLSTIYTLIYTIQEYPMIREQIIASEQGRRILIKQHEYEVLQNLKNSSIHSTAFHRKSSYTFN